MLTIFKCLLKILITKTPSTKLTKWIQIEYEIPNTDLETIKLEYKKFKKKKKSTNHFLNVNVKTIFKC